MSTMCMWLWRLYCLVNLVVRVNGSPVYEYRDFPFLNSTTATVQDSSGSLPVLVTAPSSTSHYLTSTTTKIPFWKPHIESSVDGFETSYPNLDPAHESNRVRIESTAYGFEDPTGASSAQPTEEPRQSGTTSDSDRFRPHIESTAIGLQNDVPITSRPRITAAPAAPPAVTVKEKTLRPVVVTKVVIGTVTLSPGGQTAIIGDDPSATRVYVDASGHPVVVVGSSTETYQIPATIGGQVVRPGGPAITVGSGFEQSTISINDADETIAVVEGRTSTLQVATTENFSIGDMPATAIATDYQYVVGSSTLNIGQPITIDDSTIVLTTDIAGSTILIDGDTTTTLPPLAPAQIASPLDDVLSGLSTLIVSGTTEYILSSQTLFPGHPITISGTAISVSVSSGTTVLIVGDATTTINAGSATISNSPFVGVTPAANPGTINGGQGKAEATSSTSHAIKIGWSRCNVVAIAACGMLGIGLGLG